MALVSRFEDIQGWQEARKLVKMVYSLTDGSKFSKDFGLRDQIRRAAVSAMSDIAEGFDCESKMEFARFPGLARRSAVEVQSLRYASLDLGCNTQEQCEERYEQDRKTKTLIGGFKHSLR